MRSAAAPSMRAPSSLISPAAGADRAGDGLEQGRLADAVAAEHADHLARSDGEVDAGYEVAGAVVSVQVRCHKHRQACPK